jgi:predicted transcriptional regulator
MPQSVLEIAKELTLALIEAGNVPPEDMHDTLQQTHATLLILKAQEETGATTPAPGSETPPVDWRKSITKRAITCLECGQTFKQLSIRHLSMHGFDARSYRAKYGIPRNEPLAARDTIARRRQVVRETRPWEQAPTYRRAQERDGKVLPEPEAEISRNEIEAPATAVATPTRECKTTRKKQSEG